MIIKTITFFFHSSTIPYKNKKFYIFYINKKIEEIVAGTLFKNNYRV